MRFVQQVFAHVITDSAGADDRDPTAGGLLAAEQFVVADHRGVVDAGNLRHPGFHPGGQHHVVEPGEQLFGCGSGKPYLDA